MQIQKFNQHFREERFHMLNVFKKVVPTQIAKLEPFGVEIAIEKGERLLSAALRQGLDWPHRCKVGSCGTCKAVLICGEIKPQLDFAYVLTDKEIDEGYILACQSMLKSDISVRVVQRKEMK